MVSDGQAFNKVKNLLSKLDRSIDEARDKRLGKGHDDSPPIGGGSTTPPAQHGNNGTTSNSHAANPSSHLIGKGSATPSDRFGASSSPRVNAPQPSTAEHLSDAPIGVGTTSSAPEAGKSGFGRAKPLARPLPTPDTRRWGT